MEQQGTRDLLIGWMLILLGLRVSELVSVCWTDFHKDITETAVWLSIYNGKGGKYREVKVPDPLWKMLTKYRRELEAREEHHAKVFPITARQVERIFQLVRHKAGIEKKVTPHWLRHTNATMALLYGASLQQVQENLGHAQLNTTQRYLHTVEQMKKSAPDYVANGLQDLFDKLVVVKKQNL